MDNVLRQVLAIQMVEDLQAQGCSPGDILNVLAEATGMLAATLSADPATLARNVSQYTGLTGRFAQAYHTERRQLLGEQPKGCGCGDTLTRP